MSLRELAGRSKGRGGRHGRLLTPREIRRIRRRGYRAERELVKRLRECGFKSVRIPLSAPSSEPLPDIFATRGDCIIAIEVKAPNSERAYFREEQIKKLFDFLDLFEAYRRRIAIIGAKFPYKWVLKVVDKPADYVIQKSERGDVTPRSFNKLIDENK